MIVAFGEESCDPVPLLTESVTGRFLVFNKLDEGVHWDSSESNEYGLTSSRGSRKLSSM